MKNLSQMWIKIPVVSFWYHHLKLRSSVIQRQILCEILWLWYTQRGVSWCMEMSQKYSETKSVDISQTILLLYKAMDLKCVYCWWIIKKEISIEHLQGNQNFVVLSIKTLWTHFLTETLIQSSANINCDLQLLLLWLNPLYFVISLWLRSENKSVI